MRNYKTYYQRMSTNIEEKTDFIIKELKNGDYKEVLDFGCADGALTVYLAKMFPNIVFYGYDLENVILDNRANQMTYTNLFYITNLNRVHYNDKTLIIFSSVLHEIFSNYDTAFTFIDDYYFHFEEAKTICIRDMYFTTLSNKQNHLKEKHKNQIIQTLYKNNADEESKEKYDAIPWDFLNNLFSIRSFKLILDVPYKNVFYKKTFKFIKNKYNTTHRKQIWKKEINKYV